MLAGQTQREFFVNEALARLDALMHPEIEGTTDSPPASPLEGESWLVGAAPTDEWIGHDGEIALFESGNWLFCNPASGMLLFDKELGQTRRFDGTWRMAGAVTSPIGGATIDQEARDAVADLVAALIEAGILAGT